MAEIIGKVIHGGEIIIRERVDNMWVHLRPEAKQRQEQALIAEARKAFPWAPRKLVVSYGQGRDYHYYLTIALRVPDCVRLAAIQERLRAAENTRCACGDCGSWDDSISGTSGDQPCVWAGCPNCNGTAVGRPILASDLQWYERRAKKVAQ